MATAEIAAGIADFQHSRHERPGRQALMFQAAIAEDVLEDRE